MTVSKKRKNGVFKERFQDGAAMFGRRPGRSAKTVLLLTFLLTFDFSFYTHNVCTDHLRQRYTLGLPLMTIFILINLSTNLSINLND